MLCRTEKLGAGTKQGQQLADSTEAHPADVTQTVLCYTNTDSKAAAFGLQRQIIWPDGLHGEPLPSEHHLKGGEDSRHGVCYPIFPL